MSNGSTFDSTKKSLEDILKEIGEGKTQLPDFQRGWVWDDDRIKSLLASVSLAFPIGALMTLETGGEGVTFKPRPVEGTPPEAVRVEPETLILDGQQRLTSLYQALLGEGPVDTKDPRGKKLKRWYFIDMGAAISTNGDREEAVVSIPEDKLVKKFGGEIGLDLTTTEKEFELGYFPARALLEQAPWRRAFNQHWDHNPEKADLFDKFEDQVIDRFRKYQIPVIHLTRSTPKEAVCLVFEKVNTGGVSLTVFELLTAAFAAENFQLRDDWRSREANLKNHYAALQKLQSDDFLQAISLLITQEKRRRAIEDGLLPHEIPGISCKRRDILKLTSSEYRLWADRVAAGFESAARFLHQQKIFRSWDVPYRTQIVPLAAIFTELGREGESDGAKRKIAKWFWGGVLGELYGGATESRFARDLPEVCAMVRGEDVEPITINDAHFSPNRLLTLRTRNSAAYKGIYALLMRDGCLDFRTGQAVEATTFFDEQMDIHHIFPSLWCDRNGVERERANSIINKTALSASTNRSIGGRAPSAYIQTLQKKAEIPSQRMDSILGSHLAHPKALRADDFELFFARRSESLLARIEEAMGKTIARDESIFTAPTDEYADEEPEWAEGANFANRGDNEVAPS